MNFDNSENQKEKTQLTLREYMQKYNSKRTKKGSNSNLHHDKEEIHISLFRLKIEEFYKFIFQNIKDYHLQLNLKGKLQELLFLHENCQETMTSSKCVTQNDENSLTSPSKPSLNKLLSLPKVNSNFDVTTTLGSNLEEGSLFHNFKPIKKASSKKISTENTEPGKECPERNVNYEEKNKLSEKDKTVRIGFRSNEKDSEFRSAIGKKMAKNNGEKHMRSQKYLLGLH